jgi:hypothetical protein
MTAGGFQLSLRCQPEPVFIQALHCPAWINTGSGWQRNNNWKPPVVIAYMSGTNNIDNGVRIVDVTGDGLPDFLYERHNPSQLPNNYQQ